MKIYPTFLFLISFFAAGVFADIVVVDELGLTKAAKRSKEKAVVVVSPLNGQTLPGDLVLVAKQFEQTISANSKDGQSLIFKNVTDGSWKLSSNQNPKFLNSAQSYKIEIR